MKLLTRFSFILTCIVFINCDNDDAFSSAIDEEQITLPTIAILGDDLNTGANFNLVKWTASYEDMITTNLQETIGFEFGFLQSTIGTELAFALDFPTTSYVFYDVATGGMRSVTDFFNPENTSNNFYTINAHQSLLTYYLDATSTCCNIYVHSYNQLSGASSESYIGNADIAPVQFNVFASDNRSFAIAVDTFTGVRNLYVNSAIDGERLGVIDVSEYGGFMYNDVRDEMYLFSFNGDAVSHVVLDINTFTTSEVNSFPLGLSISDGFNEAHFSQNEMVFKEFDGIVSSIYSYETDAIITYNSTDLINRIFEETGRGINIINTSIDLDTRTYVVMGTYMEDNITYGLVVLMSLDKEVILTLETDSVRPQEVIFIRG
ncbi:hypothetical protein [Dokdonia sp. 4H-3-7-5]|uniref:hypothetical protein n=1 Tax=Dokdonia sp. (strain 4H-3-7-5) TaxID=983548 RepID=UPI00020A62F1|nr:hypothetical protein [Dokdonia sp. 4H-3-7-5]AEE20545.1 hypothetical protein Krodi_2568 [Dokdonia sp. 4H-3-7-5]